MNKSAKLFLFSYIAVTLLAILWILLFYKPQFEQSRWQECSGLIIETQKQSELYNAYLEGWHQGIAWDRKWIYDDSTRNIGINADCEFEKFYQKRYKN